MKTKLLKNRSKYEKIFKKPTTEEQLQLLNLYNQGLFAEAIKNAEVFVTLFPTHIIGWKVLGSSLERVGKIRESLSAKRRAVEIDPEDIEALIALDNIFRSFCEWKTIDRDNIKLLNCFNSIQRYVIPIHLMLAINIFNLKHLYRAGSLAATFYCAKKIVSTPLITENTHNHKKIRIGYLSADFHNHATVFLLSGVLENRNVENFDVYLYSYGIESNDMYRSRVEKACEVFHHVHKLSDEAIARQIIEDEIDILVDLKGYTQNCRLGIQALRPAPVIVSWLGYPSTLGHERLADYIIGDSTVTPLNNAEYYSETLALMPHCYQPNDNTRPIGISPDRAQVGLPEDVFVFATFNQAYKITPEIFDIWCRLLLYVPKSILWMLKPNEIAQENLRMEMKIRGVDPERLIFASQLNQTDHLGRLQLADITIDTFPCGSHTTASDALWVGVPIVTKIGDTFASRVAASILNAMDLEELVTTNDDEYFNVALSLALNPEKLSAIKQKIAIQKSMSPLFNTPKFTRDLERLYQTIWTQKLENKREAIILKTE